MTQLVFLARTLRTLAITSFARRQIIFFHGRAAVFAVNSDTNENIIRLLMLARLPYRREGNHVCKHPSDKELWIITSLAMR